MTINAKQLPSQEELKRIFYYDPDTGVLTWRSRPERPKHWNTRYAGTFAGYQNDRHILVSLSKKMFLAHRIIWKWMTGDDPPIHVDHKDNVGINNRWSNLRLATHAQNLMNARQHIGKSLPKGVSRGHREGIYRASIRVNGRPKQIGTFDTAEAAHEAYKVAAMAAFGEFARFT